MGPARFHCATLLVMHAGLQMAKPTLMASNRGSFKPKQHCFKEWSMHKKDWCQEWDSNPRPQRGPRPERGALDHSAILTACLVWGASFLRGVGLQVVSLLLLLLLFSLFLSTFSPAAGHTGVTFPYEEQRVAYLLLTVQLAWSLHSSGVRALVL